MKRMAFGILALLSVAGVGGLSAQQGIRIGIGGGVVMPMGDYKNVDKLGWVAGADVTYWLASAPVGIRGDFEYSQTSHKDQSGVAIGGNSKLVGGLAEIVYAFGTHAAQVRPYVLGGIGYYHLKVKADVPVLGTIESSESKVGFGGGAGIALKVGSGNTRVFVEGKYVSVRTTGGSTNFIPIRAGIRFATK